MVMIRRVSTGLLSLAMLSGSAVGQFHIVLPAARTNPDTKGTCGTSRLTTQWPSGSTLQMQYLEADLLSQGVTPGMAITGITWRYYASSQLPVGPWPVDRSVIWDNYDIYLAKAANHISLMSATLADNMTNPVLVQSGELVIPQGAYVNTAPPAPQPNIWGLEMPFATPYFYEGGDLIVHVTHEGHFTAGGGFAYFDCSNSWVGWGIARGSHGAYNATTGAEQVIPISRLTIGAAQTCYANCDNSTTDPILNVEDFICFVSKFADGQLLPHEEQITHYSNCDGSTTTPVLNVEDFLCFVAAFAAGCP
jgi:hypothetical protein